MNNRDLALKVMTAGFGALPPLSAVRAAKLVRLLREEYGVVKIDAELLALAATKRPGHLGGPITPPADGEEREYTICVNGRVGVPVTILGKAAGEKVRVKYTHEKIVIK